MPTFNYGGTDLDLDWLVSYARVSSDQQTQEQGGGGIARQLENFHLFSAEYHVPEYTGLGSLVDDGTSGSSGKTLRDGAALALFLANIKKLPPKTGLVVESFSRLYRLVIDEALKVFLEIVCENGVPLITLQDRRAYTKKSFRTDKSQIYVISSAMQAARDLAENIGYYSTRAWKKRHGSITNIVPSWIVCQDGEWVADPVKAAIVNRIFTMALEMGVNTIVHTLNTEGVPVLNERKRQRGIMAWNTGSLTKLLRGRQVLGEQEVARYVDGKRQVVPGEYRKAYPAIVDPDLWQAVQAKLDSRKSGPGTGRNVTKMTNLFGDLACCHCGGRMKVHRRGNKGEYVYLGCSARRDGACDNTKFYRLDMVEAKLFALIGNLELPTQPDDKADDLGARLEMEQKEAAKLQRSIDAMAATFGDAPASIRASMAKLVKRHTDKLATVTQLERQLATLKNAKPADQELAAVQSLSARLQRLSRSALVETRGKIAQALPTLLTRLVFKPDGVVAVVNDGRKLKLGEWVAAGGVLYSPRSKQEERARGKVWSSPIRKR